MNQMMTEYQRELVVEYLYLIDQVLRRRIRVNGYPMQTYDDFYSVGCEALCRAAMTYRPESGEFAPFASVMIYHAMIDHCRKQNRNARFASDLPVDTDNEGICLQYMSTYDLDVEESIAQKTVAKAVADCKARYDGVARRGVESLQLKSLGYSSREIADRYGTSVNNVNAWISRARAKLLRDPVFLAALG